MKKRSLSYFLLVAFVLVAGVSLIQPASAQTYNVTVLPATGGSVTVNPPAGPYSFGQSVTLTATPNTSNGYVFTSWADSLGIFSGTANPITKSVEGDHVVTVTFTKVCYKLNITQPEGGTINTNPDPVCAPGLFTIGNPIRLEAVAADGYAFVKWTGDLPAIVDPNDPVIESFPMDQDNRTISAEFVKACRQVTLSKNGQGADLIAAPKNSAGCAANSYQYKVGEPILLTASPASGWKVTGWVIGGSNKPPTGNTHAFTMPALPEGIGLLAQVNYEEKATFGFTSTLPQAIAENAGTVQVEVIRDPSTVSDAGTIQYTTVELSGEATEDVDFISKSGSLAFAQGQNSRTIVIDLKDDNTTEGQESFEIRLSKTDPNIKLGVSTIEVQIIDDEGDPTIRFEQSDYTVDESSTSVTVAVTVFPLPASGDVFIDVTTQDDTATAGEDYAAIADRTLRIRVTSGQTKKTTNITLTPDNLDELDEETVILQLSNPSSNAVIASDSDAVLKIVDDDLPPLVAFGQSEYFIKKAGNTEALIPVNLSAPSGQKVKVDYKVTHESSGDIQEGRLSIVAGEVTETLAIPITSANPGDTFALQLSSPQNAELGTLNAARLYILNTDITDCHALTLTFNGYGQAPAAMSKSNSIGCPSGQYVAGELIDVIAQPKHGWYVSGWQGTIDDESTAMQNVVDMPNRAHTIAASYRMPIFFSIVNKAEGPFAGPNEEEPNDLFGLANGPIQLNKDYFGNFDDQSDIFDIYFFTVTGETNVSIILGDIPQGRDYDLVLWDERWKEKDYIALSQLGGTNPEKITATLQPGVYWVQVFVTSGAPTTAKYRLRVIAN